jgi:hypothetical protein
MVPPFTRQIQRSFFQTADGILTCMKIWTYLLAGWMASYAVGEAHAQTAPQTGPQTTNRITFQDTSLGIVSLTAEYRLVCVSQDQKHIAFPITKDGTWQILRDGTLETPPSETERVENLKFSPDGNHLAYFARLKSGEWITVRDGKGSEPYTCDMATAPVFSDDSEHMAYILCRDVDQVLVVDGKEVKVYPDAYREGGRHSGKEAIDVRTLVFGGSQISYAVVSKEHQYVVIDGKPGKNYQAISSPGPRYIPGTTNLVYGARVDSNLWVVVRNGRESARITAKGVMDFTFAASNSAALGYLELQDSPLRMKAVIMAKPGKEYFAIGMDTLRFSANGWHTLYVAGSDTEQRVVVDGQEGPIYSGISPRTPRLSPDGWRHAYGAARGEDSLAVIDGKEWGKFDYFIPSSFVFSPDNQHVVFVGTRKNKAILVVDCVEVREFDLITVPEKDYYYGRFLPVFDSPTHFHLQATRRSEFMDPEIIKVDAEIQ